MTPPMQTPARALNDNPFGPKNGTLRDTKLSRKKGYHNSSEQVPSPHEPCISAFGARLLGAPLGTGRSAHGAGGGAGSLQRLHRGESMGRGFLPCFPSILWDSQNYFGRYPFKLTFFGGDSSGWCSTWLVAVTESPQWKDPWELLVGTSFCWWLGATRQTMAVLGSWCGWKRVPSYPLEVIYFGALDCW